MIPTNAIKTNLMGRMPLAITSMNNLFHPTTANPHTAMIFAHTLLPPSMVRATEVLLPYRFLTSVAAADMDATTTTTADSTTATHESSKSKTPTTLDADVTQHPLFRSPFFSSYQHPISIFDQFLNSPFNTPFFSSHNQQFRQLLNYMDNSRMNRWLLMPKNSPFGDILESSNNVYNTATFDETSKMWSIPLKIPNIFRPDDVSVHIIKDGSMSGENYAVRVSGHSKMENKVDAGKTEKDEKSRAAGSVDEAVDSDKSNDMGQKSLSEYHYEMQFPLPQKIPKYSSNEVKDYLSQIKSKWNKDEGTLTVQIPDWMVCKELAMDAKNKEDEIVFKIPVGLE